MQKTFTLRELQILQEKELQLVEIKSQGINKRNIYKNGIHN